MRLPEPIYIYECILNMIYGHIQPYCCLMSAPLAWSKTDALLLVWYRSASLWIRTEPACIMEADWRIYVCIRKKETKRRRKRDVFYFLSICMWVQKTICTEFLGFLNVGMPGKFAFAVTVQPEGAWKFAAGLKTWLSKQGPFKGIEQWNKWEISFWKKMQNRHERACLPCCEVTGRLCKRPGESLFLHFCLWWAGNRIWWLVIRMGLTRCAYMTKWVSICSETVCTRVSLKANSDEGAFSRTCDQMLSRIDHI